MRLLLASLLLLISSFSFARDLTLAWDYGSGAEWFEVQWKNPTSWVTVANIPTVIGTHTYSTKLYNVMPGTLTAQVRAVNTTTFSDWSSITVWIPYQQSKPVIMEP